MDIKAKITELVEKLTKDSALKEKFLSDPMGQVKSLVGKDVPDDAVSKIVEGVKAKLNLDSAKGVVDKIKNLF